MVDVEKLIEEVRIYPVLYDQSSGKYRNSEYKEKIWKIITEKLGIEGGVEECKKKWSSVRDQLRRTIQKRKTKSGQAALRNRKYKYEENLTFLLPHLREWEELLSTNVPKSQNDDLILIEPNDDNQQYFIQEPCQQWAVNEAPPTKEIDVAVPGTSIETIENSIRPSLPATNQHAVKQDKFTKPKAMKRKISRHEEAPQDSPSRELMAFILAEKEAEKKAPSQQDPIDAFLGGIAPSLKALNPYLLNEAKGKIFAVVQEMEMRQLISGNTAQICFTAQ